MQRLDVIKDEINQMKTQYEKGSAKKTTIEEEKKDLADNLKKIQK